MRPGLEGRERATAGPTRPGTAVLKTVTGPCAGQIIELKADRVLIGRSPDCQVMLDSNGVSRKHAEIYRKGDDFYLADLNARNQTEVNFTKVIPGTRSPARIRATGSTSAISSSFSTPAFPLTATPAKPRTS